MPTDDIEKDAEQAQKLKQHSRLLTGYFGSSLPISIAGLVWEYCNRSSENELTTRLTWDEKGREKKEGELTYRPLF